MTLPRPSPPPARTPSVPPRGGGAGRSWSRLALLSLLLPGWLLLTGCGRSPEAAGGPKGGGAAAGDPPRAAPGKDALTLLFTYGSEKEEWIKDVTARFNAEQHRSPAGRPIVVQAVPEGSGDCLEEAATGARQAHLTSPASEAYVRLANAQWREKTGHDLIGHTDNLVLSPVVIATWKPMAAALGADAGPVGWSDVVALAKDPRGWAGRGHPEWGAFKLGHTHPLFSNSGLISVLAEAYAAAHQRNPLTAADLANPAVGAYVADLERAVVHYGSSTGFFAKKMIAGGPAYLHAAVLYESMVIESYAPEHPTAVPLVALYPKEGTFWSDHPIGVVEREWVDPEHRAAARQYVDFLLAPPQQRLALRYGFRPGSPDVPLGPPLDAAHGVDPRQPQTVLPLPGAEVLGQALALWKDHKKPAAVTLVLDVSGSMNDEQKIQNARAGARLLVDGLDDRDRFSLLIFNNRLSWLFDHAPLARDRDRARQTLDGLIAQGGTALYDAVGQAYQQTLRARQADPGSIHAVVVLTDGADTDSRTSLPQLLKAVRSDQEGRDLRVFTIAYGREADTSVLQQIADATQAKSYRGTPENIREVFRDIATFF